MSSLVALLLCAAQEEDRRQIPLVCEEVRRSFVAVEILLRRKTRLEKADLDAETIDNHAQHLLRLMENEQILEAWGVAVEPESVFLPDPGLGPEEVERIEMIDASGARFAGSIVGVGRDHDFVVLRPDAPRALTPLAFHDGDRPALGEHFYVTHADRVDGRWHLNVSPYIMTNAPLVEEEGWLCIDQLRRGSVVSDRDGRTVGIAFDLHLWVDPDGRSSFLGRDVADDKRLANLEEGYETLRKTLEGTIRRVEFRFRADRSNPFLPPGLATGDDVQVILFGVAVDDRGTLLVPTDLPREQIRRIEEIHVSDGARAEFVGSFRDFSAMIVRAPTLAGAPGIVADAPPVPRGRLFFTASVEDRFGRNRFRFDYNRLFRAESGLRGALRAQPRRRIARGTFLLDLEGRIVGFASNDKKDEDLDERAVEASRRNPFGGKARGDDVPDHLRRLFFFGELAPLLADPATHFDAKAVPMTQNEEKSLVWLGVEYQPLTKPLAESLSIQERDLTNDGRRGLIVTEIYPGSPAERAGLRIDDVLLTTHPEGEGVARDLAAPPERYPYGGGRLSPQAATPWKAPRNYLTTILTEIGSGKKVVLGLLRGREKLDVELALEDAPKDYETAERYKDEGLGLTVKELTYEVRYFHRLDPGAPGIVVARVESGGKAQVGKLPPLSIISRVNHVPVRDLAHFQELLATPGTLMLTTISYGQSQIIELARD